jgi:hypothetical protein
MDNAFLKGKISLIENWLFHKFDSMEKADERINDINPAVSDLIDDKVADLRPSEAVKFENEQIIIKN